MDDGQECIGIIGMAGREEGLVEEAICVVSLLLLKASQAFFEILNIFSNFLKYPQRETSLYWRKAYSTHKTAPSLSSISHLF